VGSALDANICIDPGLLREQETPLVIGKNWFLDQEIPVGGRTKRTGAKRKNIAGRANDTGRGGSKATSKWQ